MPVTRAQMNALLDRLEGPIRQQFANAIRAARGRANLTALANALEAGDIDAAMAAVGIRDGMWSGLTEAVRSAYVEAGVFTLGNAVPKRFGMVFNIGNPRAETWLRNHSSEFVTRVSADQRAAIQTLLQSGMAQGQNPRAVALEIVGRVGPTGRTGGVIGLTGQQAEWMVNMAEDLEELNWSRYKSRLRRDKRFDSLVRASINAGQPLPAATRQKIVQRYADRMLKYRGNTIGRTEALAALNEAADEALRQAVYEEGLAPPNAVKRIWRHSFQANEREGHKMMNGTAKGLEEAFTNPLTGAVLKHPGDGPAGEVINCRCYLEHKIDFVKVAQAEAA